jgi:hypothetical protein
VDVPDHCGDEHVSSVEDTNVAATTTDLSKTQVKPAALVSFTFLRPGDASVTTMDVPPLLSPWVGDMDVNIGAATKVNAV